MASPTMKFEERTGVDIFRFERDNDTLTGLLTKMQDVTINNKSVPAYIIAEYRDDFTTPTGRQFQVAQSADLRAKLGSKDIGHLVLMRRTGVRDTKNGKMTEFTVKVSSEMVPQRRGSVEITDADIPF